MKITRKMSPVLFGLVAVLVGMSMMGAAISVIVSNVPTPNKVTVSPNLPVTLTQDDVDVTGLGFSANDYPALTDTLEASVGQIYDTRITVAATAELQNVVIYFKVVKTDASDIPIRIDATDLSVKEFNDREGADAPDSDAWIPLHLESYGDYVLGYFENNRNGIHMGSTFNEAYCFIITFASEGVYTFSWYAESQDGKAAPIENST